LKITIFLTQFRAKSYYVEKELKKVVSLQHDLIKNRKIVVKMVWFKRNIVGIVIFVVLGVGFCYFVKGCFEYGGKKITLNETLDEILTTGVDNELKHIFFDAIVTHPLHVAVQMTHLLQCSFFDFVFQNVFKNILRQQAFSKSILVKMALKSVVYDANSSHFYFSCRYHVLALREIII
jgi:hypothetical protein